MDKIGFCLCLIGLAGLAEAYGRQGQMSTSLIIIMIGGLLIFIGDMKHDVESYKRTNNNNNLDRLYFLKK